MTYMTKRLDALQGNAGRPSASVCVPVLCRPAARIRPALRSGKLRASVSSFSGEILRRSMCHVDVVSYHAHVTASAAVYHALSTLPPLVWFAGMLTLAGTVYEISKGAYQLLLYWGAQGDWDDEDTQEPLVLYGVSLSRSCFFSRESVRRAVEFAARAHHCQKRRTGEPYVVHCIETALIVESNLGQLEDEERAEAAVVAALLHDVLDDTNVELSEIQEEFGERVADMVKKVSQLSHANQLLRRRKRQGLLRHSPEEERALWVELKNMILAMVVAEPLVVLIKLADRLHNMRTVFVLKPDKQRSVADETLEVWCSMAERLGWDAMKSEIEDLCFAVLQPDLYTELRLGLHRLWGLEGEPEPSLDTPTPAAETSSDASTAAAAAAAAAALPAVTDSIPSSISSQCAFAATLAPAAAAATQTVSVVCVSAGGGNAGDSAGRRASTAAGLEEPVPVAEQGADLVAVTACSKEDEEGRGEMGAGYVSRTVRETDDRFVSGTGRETEDRLVSGTGGLSGASMDLDGHLAQELDREARVWRAAAEAMQARRLTHTLASTSQPSAPPEVHEAFAHMPSLAPKPRPPASLLGQGSTGLACSSSTATSTAPATGISQPAVNPGVAQMPGAAQQAFAQGTVCSAASPKPTTTHTGTASPKPNASFQQPAAAPSTVHPAGALRSAGAIPSTISPPSMAATFLQPVTSIQPVATSSTVTLGQVAVHFPQGKSQPAPTNTASVQPSDHAASQIVPAAAVTTWARSSQTASSPSATAAAVRSAVSCSVSAGKSAASSSTVSGSTASSSPVCSSPVSSSSSSITIGSSSAASSSLSQAPIAAPCLLLHSPTAVTATAVRAEQEPAADPSLLQALEEAYSVQLPTSSMAATEQPPLPPSPQPAASLTSTREDCPMIFTSPRSAQCGQASTSQPHVTASVTPVAPSIPLQSTASYPLLPSLSPTTFPARLPTSPPSPPSSHSLAATPSPSTTPLSMPFAASTSASTPSSPLSLTCTPTLPASSNPCSLSVTGSPPADPSPSPPVPTSLSTPSAPTPSPSLSTLSPSSPSPSLSTPSPSYLYVTNSHDVVLKAAPLHPPPTSGSSQPPAAAPEALPLPAPPPPPLTPQQRRLKAILSTVASFDLSRFGHQAQVPQVSGLRALDAAANELLYRIRAGSYSAGLAITVQGRLKSIRSVYQKMQQKELAVDEVYDARGLRVIVDDEQGAWEHEAMYACYRVEQTVRGMYKLIPGQYDDYIANPKPSGYRALHMAVRGPDGQPMEVQIKSGSMHQHAEFGGAAHWAYKEQVPLPRLVTHPAQANKGPYVGQPVIQVDFSGYNGKFRYGVVVGVDPTSTPSQLLVAVRCGGTIPEYPFWAPISFYNELQKYATANFLSKGLRHPGNGDLKMVLEQYVECTDGRYHRLDQFGKVQRYCTVALKRITALDLRERNSGLGFVPHNWRQLLQKEAEGDPDRAQQLRKRQRAFVKTQMARRRLAGRGADTPPPAPEDEQQQLELLQGDEVAVLIWPDGEIAHFPWGTTAGAVVKQRGILEIESPGRGLGEGTGVVNVNNQLVPESTRLEDGDLLILSREKLKI